MSTSVSESHCLRTKDHNLYYMYKQTLDFKRYNGKITEEQDTFPNCDIAIDVFINVCQSKENHIIDEH